MKDPKDLKITVYIDDEVYTDRQIEAYEYLRNIHVLHQMIHLGAEITDNGKVLSYDDVDFLNKEDAQRLVYEAKKARLGDEIRELYKDQCARMDEFWRDIVKDWSPEDECKKTVVTLEADGLTINEFMLLLKKAGTEASLKSNPEHYSGYPYPTDVHYGMETMGMFALPTDGIAAYQDVIDTDGIEMDPGFIGKIGGHVELRSDGTNTHIYTSIQHKQTEKGVVIRPTIFWPKNTPDTLVEGHKIHLAVEYYEMIKLAKQAESAW